MVHPKLNLALIQMNSRPLDRAANLAHMDARLAAIAGKADLAVMPECADVGYTPDRPDWLASAEPVPGKTVEALSAMARRHAIALACGVLEADRHIAGVYYSSVAVIDSSGELTGITASRTSTRPSINGFARAPSCRCSTSPAFGLELRSASKRPFRSYFANSPRRAPNWW
jgi:predicted amidohydrolase